MKSSGMSQSCRLKKGLVGNMDEFFYDWSQAKAKVMSGLRFCGHVKPESKSTYIVGLGLSLGNLILVQSEAGGNPAEPNVSQHVLVICHAAAAAPSGT